MPEATSKHPSDAPSKGLKRVPPAYNDRVREAMDQLVMYRNSLDLTAAMIDKGPAQEGLRIAAAYIDQAIKELHSVV